MAARVQSTMVPPRWEILSKTRLAALADSLFWWMCWVR